MWKALITKELRETAWIAAVALLLYLHAVASLAGFALLPWTMGREASIPFVGDGFNSSFTWIAALLAVALGFRQSAVESPRGTWLFLLHRPTSWRSIVGAKLLAGIALYLAVSAVPILIYAWWAATPGTHASPFFWSMTVDAWQIWLGLAVLYLGAFLSGLRPGRWFGTRLAPLAAVAILVLGIEQLPWWWALGLPLLALLGLIVCGLIFHVARTRDYS